MATNFPGSLDALTNPSGTDNLDSPDHADQHIDINDGMEAVQAKVGADSSAVTTSHDYRIKTLEDKGSVFMGNSVTESSVSGTTAYTEKLSVSFTPTTAGTYKVELSCTMASSNKRASFLCRGQYDNTTTPFEIKEEPTETKADGSYRPVSGFWYQTMTAAAHTVDIDYACSTTGDSAYIKNVYVVITRIA